MYECISKRERERERERTKVSEVHMCVYGVYWVGVLFSGACRVIGIAYGLYAVSANGSR